MGSQRDHRFLGWVRATDRRFGAGSVPATGRAGETPAGATVVKIVNFPDPMLDRFVADLLREGFSIIDPIRLAACRRRFEVTCPYSSSGSQLSQEQPTSPAIRFVMCALPAG